MSVYEHYDVDVPFSKAKLYIKNKLYVENNDEEKYINPTLQKYFIPASKQDADFILKFEKFRSEQDNKGWVLLSAATVFIVPSWSTHRYTYSFSLADVASKTTVQLSDIHRKRKVYTGLLLSPVLFSSKFKLSNSIVEQNAKAATAAIEEAAS